MNKKYMANDEKTKKILKVGGVVLGLVLLYSMLTLFFGGGAQTRRSGNELKNSGMGGYGLSSPTPDNGVMNFEGSVESMAPESSMMKRDVAQNSFTEVAADESTQIIDKKVIKNGELNLKVESADWMVGEISNITKQKGGEVFSTNFYERVKGQKSGSVTIKVPVDKFEETIAEIKKIAVQVLSESTTGRDVTEQYTDLQAQLKNKKAEEESFVKILGTAGKIDDVLAATREVARVRGEIERLEGRIRFMDSQTDMSTITIELTEDVTVTPVGEGWRPWQVVKESFKELIVNIQGFADGIIRFIIVGIPSLIPFALLVGFLYWVGKKIFNKISA
jgi:hypothetical protein